MKTMSPYTKNQKILQTFFELDTQISRLTKTISANRYIEIGDDPYLVEGIENLLSKLHKKVKSIGPYFDLTNTPLKNANVYFSLTRNIGETLHFLKEVRQKEYGSINHTQQLLNKLKSCTDSINAIGELITARSERIQ